MEVILHIGFHKTGTTYLQKHVFPNLNEIIYLGRSWAHKELNGFFYDFYYEPKETFDAAKFKDRFYKIVEEVIEQKNLNIEKARAIFISHESLHCGPMYFGQAINEQADRIKAVFPRAKIIIGVRDQLKMIESHYTNYIHHGGKLSFSAFCKSEDYTKGLKPKLAYDRIVNLYVDKFQRSNVHVCVFEHMFSKQAIVLTELLNFLGLPDMSFEKQQSVNPKLSKSSIRLVRSINLLLAKSFYIQYRNRLRGDKLLSEKIRWFVIRILKKIQSGSKQKPKTSFHYLDDQQQETLRSHFEKSNRNLSAIINVELNQFGYY